MKRLLLFLLETRVERLTRELLRHAERHCLGHEEAHCPKWAAISEMYDEAVNRYNEAAKS